MSATTALVLPILCLIVGGILVLVIVALRVDRGDLLGVLRVMRDIVRDLARHKPMAQAPSVVEAHDEDGGAR